MSEPYMELVCGSYPGYKRKVLSIREGSMVRPLAFFKDDAAMEEFLSLDVRYTPQAKEESDGNSI